MPFKVNDDVLVHAVCVHAPLFRTLSSAPWQFDLLTVLGQLHEIPQMGDITNGTGIHVAQTVLEVLNI